MDRFILADNFQLEAILQMQQPVHLLLSHFVNRNAGHHGHGVGHIVFGHQRPFPGVILFPLPLGMLDPFQQVPFLVTQSGGLFEILLAHHLLLLPPDRLHLLFQIHQFLRNH